jgi:hypothetical protein
MSKRDRELLHTPGGIYHWRRILSALASKEAEAFLPDLGFAPGEGGVPVAAAGAVAGIDSVLGPESARREMTPAAFASRSEEALNAALGHFRPNQRDVVVRLGTWSENHGSQAFTWSTVLSRLARLDVENRPPNLPGERFDEIVEWADSARSLRQQLERARHTSAETDQSSSEGRQESDGTLNDLLTQSHFDAFWHRIQEWPEDNRRELIRLAETEAAPLGIADKLHPEV